MLSELSAVDLCVCGGGARSQAFQGSFAYKPHDVLNKVRRPKETQRDSKR